MSGSWIGAAEHTHRWTGSWKCSGRTPGRRGRPPPRCRSRWCPRRLAPQRAFGEVHDLFGAQPDRGVALDAQQHAVRVADHDQVAALLGGLRRGSRGSAARRAPAGGAPSTACVSSSSDTIGASRLPVGSTPAANERRHESAIAVRTSSRVASSSSRARAPRRTAPRQSAPPEHAPSAPCPRRWQARNRQSYGLGSCGRPEPQYCRGTRCGQLQSAALGVGDRAWIVVVLTIRAALEPSPRAAPARSLPPSRHHAPRRSGADSGRAS